MADTEKLPCVPLGNFYENSFGKVKFLVKREWKTHSIKNHQLLSLYTGNLIMVKI